MERPAVSKSCGSRGSLVFTFVYSVEEEGGKKARGS